MQEADNSWIFDSLVCFLNGPVWNVPLRNFIEEKSLIFDPNNLDGEEHRKIFQEYKNLVDAMLESYMDDINITPEQFQYACNQGNRTSLPSGFDQNLFEQIWAANLYDIFKRMMAQKNVELQLQALELLENKYGVMPQSFIPQGPTSSETKVMQEVTKQFSDEASSAKTDVPSNAEVQYLMEEKQILQDQLKKTLAKDEEGKPSESLESAISFDKKPMGKPIDGDELKKRQEYLRSQRDKLVALKKEARKKQFSQQTAKVVDRPKSAKVAQAIVDGHHAPTNAEEKIRQSLVQRLKNEVVFKGKK